MERIKIDFSAAKELHNQDTFNIGGASVTVIDHIPVSDKIAFSEEYAALSTVGNEDSKILLQNSAIRVIEVFLMVKYYTNVDVSDADPYDVYDWVINNNAFSVIENYISADFYETKMIADGLLKNILDLYKRDNSLELAAMKSFGSVLNGEDITETVAGGQVLNEELLGLLGKIRSESNAKEDNEDGTINLGGNVINITKKAKK